MKADLKFYSNLAIRERAGDAAKSRGTQEWRGSKDDLFGRVPVSSDIHFIPQPGERLMKVKLHNLILSAMVLLSTLAGAATQVVEGEAWNGAKYLLAVPEDWNGDLVVYAHGYVDRVAPIALPTTQDNTEVLRDKLLTNGFAVAYSSYSKNGFAVREGTIDTLCLNWYFKKAFGKPARTFLVGHSLGGLVCVRLAECLPRHYDGVLTVSGMIGGSQVEIDYVTNVRILWEMHYPGVLPGSIDYVPPGLDLMTNVVYPVIGAISANPTNAIAMTTIEQTPLPWDFVNGNELVGSFANVLGFYYRGHADLAERTGTPTFIDNRKTEYTSWMIPDVQMELINKYVPRFSSTRQAKKYFWRNYESTGKLRVPMLGIHNSRDPVVPIFHQEIYAEKVAKRTCTKNLVQRQFDRHGHTETITVDEVFSAFEELVEWVDTGAAPAP